MQNDKQHDILAWLKDIEQSINEIYEFLPKDRNFFAFKKDLKTRKVVERNIEIIGEVMDRILKANPNFQIIDSRNRIIHGYDNIVLHEGKKSLN